MSEFIQSPATRGIAWGALQQAQFHHHLQQVCISTPAVGSLTPWNHPLKKTHVFWEEVEDRKFIGNKLIKALKWLLCQMMFLKCLMNHNQIYVINRRWLQIHGNKINIVACSLTFSPHEPVRPPKLSSAEPSVNLKRRSSKKNWVQFLKETVLVVLVCLSYYWTKARAWCQQHRTEAVEETQIFEP